MARQTFVGSCHCGAVRYRVQADLSKGVRCNCSLCTKQRNWAVMVMPAEFDLLQGEEMLSVYTRTEGSVHQHTFCRHCGVRTFTRSFTPELGDFRMVNIPTLDATDEELAHATVTYMNGRNNDWSHPPAITGHL